ncbi:hypothetical protein N7532_002207 [Penicillium argentinense]|uniref:Sulfotransferase family protein n=1 Tax=Penicillium argentinense TaxID=1131581 RepID=A0A9W9KLA5_9EURO|nr:uncharacterized protein N7532_002207 [Penicillium argentinense]KAJ5109562.1 hypothetical protein N7532_002207 [Penicillium argentinense]
MTVTNESNGTPAGRRLLFISVPRTASNLLLRIVNIPKQPNLHTTPKGGYFFYPAFIESTQNGSLVDKPADQWTAEDINAVKTSSQACLDSLEEYSSRAAQNNQLMFTKEHAYWMFSPATRRKFITGLHDDKFFEAFRVNTPEKYGPKKYSRSNETMFSDEYLRSWQMVFIIRHPALAWPSMYRAMLKLGESGVIDEDGVKGASVANMTFHWTRLLHDWCLEQLDVPVSAPVVDAHDLIHHPEIVLQLCEQTGLDKSVVQFEWADKSEKKSLHWACHNSNADPDEVKLHQQAAGVMLSTLESSAGIIKDKAPETIDIAAEAAKWRGEFGEDVGTLIERCVRDSMSDYEYLKARRITV